MNDNLNFNKRVITSFISNVVRAGIAFLTGILTARWLGPEEYGRLAYLLATFLAVRQLFDLSSSSAFFTFISQKKRSLYFIQIYFTYLIIQFIVAILLISFILPNFIIQAIWGNESRLILILAFFAVYIQNTIWPLVSQMGEAQRETVKVQFVNNIFVIIHLLIICLAYYFKELTIILILFSIILEWTIASLFIKKLYKVHSKYISENEIVKDDFSSICNKFLFYCIPLIPYVLLSFSHDFLDRWMLQKWGGNLEQSFFSVGQQIAAISLIATVSIQRVVWKEFSEAIESSKFVLLKELFIKTSMRLFFFASFVTGFMLPLIPYFVDNLLGVKYRDAIVVISIMLLYPVHQVYGQMGFTLLYATEKNKLHSRLGQFFILTSLIASFFILAPQNFFIPGLALKATGLAWKLVVLQIIHVNILLFYISKEFKWEFDFFYQFKILVFFVSLGLIIKSLILYVFYDNQFEILTLLLYFSIYICSTLFIIFITPSLISLNKSDVNSLFFKIKNITQK